MIKFKDTLSFNIMDGDKKIVAEVILCHVPRSIKKKYLFTSGGDTLYLHRLWVRKKDRNRGLGGLVMQMALDYANNNGISLVLRCLPFDASGLRKKKLAEFYRRKRFEPMKGSNELFFRH